VHESLPDGVECDDGNECTGMGHCFAGQCERGEFVSCDDHDACAEEVIRFQQDPGQPAGWGSGWSEDEDADRDGLLDVAEYILASSTRLIRSSLVGRRTRTKFG